MTTFADLEREIRTMRPKFVKQNETVLMVLWPKNAISPAEYAVYHKTRQGVSLVTKSRKQAEKIYARWTGQSTPSLV